MQLPRVVYHLAEAANWPSIQRDGLLPATLLLQRFVRDDAERAALQQRQRPRHVVLTEGVEIRINVPCPRRRSVAALSTSPQPSGTQCSTIGSSFGSTPRG
jgi:hypothetical protein